MRRHLTTVESLRVALAAAERERIALADAWRAQMESDGVDAGAAALIVQHHIDNAPRLANEYEPPEHVDELVMPMELCLQATDVLRNADLFIAPPDDDWLPYRHEAARESYNAYRALLVHGTKELTGETLDLPPITE